MGTPERVRLTMAATLCPRLLDGGARRYSARTKGGIDQVFGQEPDLHLMGADDDPGSRVPSSSLIMSIGNKFDNALCAAWAVVDGNSTVEETLFPLCCSEGSIGIRFQGQHLRNEPQSSCNLLPSKELQPYNWRSQRCGAIRYACQWHIGSSRVVMSLRTVY
jgi:hypothetical protein